MSDAVMGFLGMLLFGVMLFLVLSAPFHIGLMMENNRLYKSCMLEMQDKTHKEAVEICKERTKE